MLKIGGFAVYNKVLYNGAFEYHRSLIDKQIVKSGVGLIHSRYTDIKYKPTDKDIVIVKNQQFQDEIFDLYRLELNQEFRNKLRNEMEMLIQKVMSDNEIKIPNLTINIAEQIKLTKEQVELIKEEKIELNPYIDFKFGTTETNLGVDVVTSLEININVSIDENKTNENNVRRTFLPWFW